MPFQDEAAIRQFPEVPQADYERAVQLLETDGSVFSGAEAAFRALAYNPRWRWSLGWYQHSHFFALGSETFYRVVARHRRFFSFLTRLGWGRDVGPQTHFLVRSIFIRSIALIYLIAFVSLWLQIDGLVGERGILPAKQMMDSVREQARNGGAVFSKYRVWPTLCWWSSDDRALHAQCLVGAVLAVLAAVGIAEVPCLFLLWILYLSLSTVCREFLSFQWDVLLLESGFLAIVFAPVRWGLWQRKMKSVSTPLLWLLRWLVFRVMFESGCVKLISKDPTWRDHTALYYHYETQPLPTWIGWFVHQMPAAFQRADVVIVFIIELVLPFLIFAPRRIRHFAAFAFVVLQLFILLTGNYGFFNLLSIALCIPLLDDRALRSLWPRSRAIPRTARTVATDPIRPDAAAALSAPSPFQCYFWCPLRLALVLIIVPITILQFSFMFGGPPAWAGPLIEVSQAIVPFRIVNTYGLFAVMTTSRQEIVVQGSDDGVNWLDYDFKYKPQDLGRRPMFVAPYQPRLDWQMWFAALGSYRENPWFVNFCVRLLQGSPPVLKLLRSNPFPGVPPKYVRAILFNYRFTNRLDRHATGNWWRRSPAGEYLPPISLR